MSEQWPPPEPDDVEEAAPIIAGQPHPVEWVRDIPRACTCTWVWNVRIRAYELERERYGCPWHGHDIEGA